MEQKVSEKEDIGKRLKRITGQVRGIRKMLTEDKPCKDILIQIAAVKAAIWQVGNIVVASYTRKCLVDGECADCESIVKDLITLLSGFNEAKPLEQDEVDIESRLQKIEDQIQDIQNMLDADRNCKDILSQVASIKGAVWQVGNILIANYTKKCLLQEDQEKQKKSINELIDLLVKFNK